MRRDRKKKGKQKSTKKIENREGGKEKQEKKNAKETENKAK